MSSEFSYRTRKQNLNRLRTETFDFLIIGGGITGAATARDAALRGFRVALLEKGDFASGTSSTSSKLVHGGLRYLENFEFRLVFESLSERGWQIRDLPHLVRPLRFFVPVYRGEKRGMSLISLGLWLYDLLSLLRTPGLHRRHSPRKMAEKLPGLNPKGLKGGFSYYDATMWDDLLVVENLRAAEAVGALAVNYVEATEALTADGRIVGTRARDTESGESFEIRATRTIVAAGPWTDRVGKRLAGSTGDAWEPVLEPSRGIHLVFERDRLPVEGAVLMLHPVDGRVSFVIPRDDFGAGVVMVGTTDGPAAADPDHQPIPADDEAYLIDLLGRFFPGQKITQRDVISRTIGIRPLVHSAVGDGSGGLSKVSREHWISTFPNGVTYVAGGKYTTHREMALEIIDHAIAAWDEGARKGTLPPVPRYALVDTQTPLLFPAVEEIAQSPADVGLSRFGAESPLVRTYDLDHADVHVIDPAGFPFLKGQFLFSVRHEMILTLEDFWFRRTPLYLARRDHGEDFIAPLAELLRRERGVDAATRESWIAALGAAIARRDER